MKETTLTTAADELVEEIMEAIDDLVEEIVDPLADVGNPERLLHKPYEAWTAADMQMLQEVYRASPQTLERFIFNKEYERLKQLEARNV